MYSSMCFMSVVALLVTDMRTGALENSDVQPSQCYNCYANTTSCEQSSSWTSVACPIKRPLCATITSAPDFQSSLVCAPVTEKPCTVETTTENLNSSFFITCVCLSHLCNAPFIPKWRDELLGYIHNSTDVKQQEIYQLLFKFTNVSEEDKLYKAMTVEMTDLDKKVITISPQSYTSVPSPITINAHIGDAEKPRAESLKQEPTVPSDDDEDESEGSGSFEESKIHNRHASAPAAPSSFLPANENSASVLYKDLLIFNLLMYLVL